MVIIMETGKRIEDEFGAFEEEVLNAQWLPQPSLQLAMQEFQPAIAARPIQDIDVDAFLRTVYQSQE